MSTIPALNVVFTWIRQLRNSSRRSIGLVLGMALYPGCAQHASVSPQAPSSAAIAQTTSRQARLTPQPIMSPQAKLRRSMIDSVRAAKDHLCNVSKVAELRDLVQLRSELERASHTSRRPAVARKLATFLKAAAPAEYTDKDYESLNTAAVNRAQELQEIIRADSTLTDAGAAAIGSSCDDSCVDVIVRTCVDPDADLATRSDGMVGTSLLPGLSWQSSVATGLADFLRDRTLSEAASWLANEVRRQLCRDLKSYFVHTCRFFANVSGETSQVTGALAASAIRADLEELPLRIARVDTDDKWAEGVGTELLFRLIDGIRKGDAPLTLIAGLDENELLRKECPNPAAESLSCSLRRIGSLVFLLGGASQPTRAGQEPDFASLARQLKEGIGQLQQNSRLCPKDSASALTICRIRRDLPLEKTEELLRTAHQLSERLRTYSDKNMSNEERLIASGEILLQSNMILRDAQDIWGMSNATKARWADMEQAIETTALLMRGKRAEAALNVIDYVSMNVDNCKRVHSDACIPPKLLKYLPLVVDIANAERPEDVQAALQSAAAPVGSWRIKRVEAPIASITAFVGGAAGQEIPVKGNGKPSTAAAGAIAALGLDLSLIGGKYGEGGVLVSLIDVGQLLTTPVDPSAKQTTDGRYSVAKGGAQLELVQLLSPGAYLHYGVGDTPLVLGAGYSIAPRLRKYVTASESETTQDNVTVHRLLVFVGIDVTLFPL